ncbi:MAG: glycosyltransferase [Candidatus Bathyarchaeia archaeon]
MAVRLEYTVGPSTVQTAGVSVIMPAYNTAGQILGSLVRVEQTLSRVTGDYEVIVVDDGSLDGTGDIIESYSRLNHRVRLVSCGRNMGKGYALRRGFSEASKDIVAFLDSDSDIDAVHLKAYVEALEGYSMVVASKRHPQSDYRAPFMRKILSVTFNMLVKLLLGIRCSDTQAGLKVFRRTEFGKIMRMGLVKRYAFDVELLALASLLKLRVREAPVKIRMSARFSLKQVMYMILDLMGIFYRLKVIGWYQKNLNSGDVEYKPIIRI